MLCRAFVDLVSAWNECLIGALLGFEIFGPSVGDGFVGDLVRGDEGVGGLVGRAVLGGEGSLEERVLQ